MYNNFSSKKTKKVISALLASALVVTSAPITADAATTKVLGIKKTFTVKKTTKVSGLSKAEKKIVKVTVNKKKKTVTVKGVKPGKASFKIGSKSYTVKVGAVKIKKKSFATTLTAGTNKSVSVVSSYGAKDKLAWSSSKTSVVKVSKSTTTADSKKVAKNTLKPIKAGTATITVKSKNTGKKLSVKVTVKAATTPTVAPTATVSGGATTAPSVEPTATTTATTNPTEVPTGSATTAPTEVPTGSATTAPTEVPTGSATTAPTATGSATTAPTATGSATTAPTEAPTATPEVVTGGTITVTGAAVSGASVVITNVSGAAVYTGTANGAGATTDTLPAGKYYITVKNSGYDTKTTEVTIEDKDAKVVTIELEESLKVASVEALNLAEVQIKFNKALTTTQVSEAKKAASYKVYKDGSTSDATIANISVSEDATTVTLLLDSSNLFENGKKENKVVVSKALGLAGDYSATVESTDVKVPGIDKVEAVGNKVIKITFTEAVNVADINNLNASNIYTLNTPASGNGFENTDTAKISDDKKTVTITLTTPLVAGTHKLTIANGKIADFATYTVPGATKEFTVTEATTVAQASSVKVVDRKTVNVVFTGAVSTEGAPVLTWKSATTSKNSTSVKAVGNNTLQFTFADTIPTGTVDFVVDSIKDAYGYVVPSRTFEKVEVVASSIATATVEVVDDDTIDVIFSQKMQNGTATNSITTGDASNKANYVLKDAKGETVSLTEANATYSENATTGVYKVRLTKTDWNLEAGVYTLSVSGVKDTYGDEMTALVNEAITVKDTTKPGVLNNTVYGASDSRKISISFTEAMATSGDNSITNASNYQYAADGSTFTDLPTGTTLVASTDGKSVIITLPSGTTLTANTSVIQIGTTGSSSVKTVADAAGNIFKELPGSNSQFTIAADASVSLTGAVKVKDASTLRLAVNGTLTKVDAADFYYTVNGGKSYEQAKSATLVVDDGTQYVDLGLKDALTVNSVRENIYVKTVVATGATKLKSETALGTALTSLAISTEITGDLSTWPFRASLKSAEVLNQTQIRVTFDGLVDASDDNLLSFLKVTNGTTTKGQIKTTDVTVAQYGSNSVILTYVEALDTTATTTVKTALYSTLGATTNWAKDTNDVYYNENTTGVTATNATSLRAQGITITGLDTDNSVKSGTAVKLTYNQPVKAGSIGVAAGTVTATIDTAGKLIVSDSTGTKSNLGTISGFTVAGNSSVADASAALAISGNDVTITFGASVTAGATVDGKIKYVPGANLTDELNNGINTSVTVETAGDYIAPAVDANTNSGKATVTIADATDGKLAVGDKVKVTFTEAVNITNLGIASFAVKEGAEAITAGDYEFTITKDTADTTGKTIVITCTAKIDSPATVVTKAAGKIVLPASMIVDNDGNTLASDLTITLNDGAIA